MPRKTIHSKEEIIGKAFAFVRKRGIEELTVRNLAEALGSSTKPISLQFSSMKALKDAVKERSRSLYSRYIVDGENEDPPHPFRGVGKAYIRFAKEEPNLFYLLFMDERKKEHESVPSALKDLDPNYEAILQSVKVSYSLSDADEEIAQSIYVGMWVVAHGIATLSASRTFSFDEKTIQNIFQKSVIGFLPNRIKTQ